MRSLRRWTLRSLLYALSAAILLPLALLVGFNIVRLYDAGRDAAQEKALRLADLTADTTETFIRDAHEVLQLLARRPQMAAAIRGGECDPIFKTFKEFYPQLTNISLSIPAGYLICSARAQPDDKPLPVADQEWFKQVYAREDFVVGPILFGPINRGWISVLAEPVRDSDGQMIGAVQTPIDLLRFRLVPAADKLPDHILITILDREGRIVASSRDAGNSIGRSVPPDFPPLALIHTKPEGVTEGTDENGVRHFYAFSPILGTDWIAVAGVDAEHALADARRSAFTSALLGLPIILLVWLFALWLTRRIQSPIERVTAAARAGAQGQLDIRVPTRGPLEIFEVAKHFNTMLDAIQNSQALVRRSEERLKLALESSRTAIWDLDLERKRIYLSETWSRLMADGASACEIPLRDLLHRIPSEDRRALRQAYRYALREHHEAFSVEHRVLDSADRTVWIALEGRISERDSHGHPLRMIGVAQDISERKAREEQIERLAYFDTLTALPNRRMLQQELPKALARARRSGLHGALMFVDLDRFKGINDARGHDTGDALLEEVARRLVRGVREGDTVARIGGDEFVVLVTGVSPDAAAAARQIHAMAEKLRATLARPYELEGQLFSSSASIGVAMLPQPEQTADDLLRAADIAMYRAKTSGRNQVAFFETTMQIDVERRLALESDLALAIERGEMSVYVQTQVDVSGQALGAEILTRWHHPTHGYVSPAYFISIAEESGLILRIGDWVLERACELAVALEARSQPGTLSVNVSPRQFHQPDFVEHVRSTLRRHGCPGHRLVFEVTESLLLDHLESTIGKMTELTTLGIHFSIDDFGTGYSSLGYLKRLPLYELKIDKSFVDGLPTDRNDSEIVQMVISLARQLHLRIVAEGVETTAQRDFLAGRGCDVLQGYLFGQPQPAETWLARLGRVTQD
ncbi:MAG: EAL domain-containing protein [Zoogloeaceae bacterium]|nr:EAL domain-containing protein [Zoogloeaceae bacterium]